MRRPKVSSTFYRIEMLRHLLSRTLWRICTLKLIPTVCFHFDCQHNEGAWNQGCMAIMEPNERNICVWCGCVCACDACLRAESLVSVRRLHQYHSRAHSTSAYVFVNRDGGYRYRATIQLNMPASACVSRKKTERNKKESVQGIRICWIRLHILWEHEKHKKLTEYPFNKISAGTIEIISNKKNGIDSYFTIDHRAPAKRPALVLKVADFAGTVARFEFPCLRKNSRSSEIIQWINR